MEFAFDKDKNDLLYRQRGVTFHMVIESFSKKGALRNFDHPNQKRYPNQKVIVVEINGYTYCVPYVVEKSIWFLKTIYPSRRFKYLLEGEANG
jgi:uncharacterized DUF497 family protein